MIVAGGIERKNRAILDLLHRSFAKPFSVADSACLLALDRPKARRLIASLAAAGWLSRIRRDLYTTVPLGATAPSEWRADPWIVGAVTFAPCYLGGWTACQQWEFTDQVFRDIVVFTERGVRESLVEIQGVRFIMRRIQPAKRVGLRSVWHGENKVEVSDPSRTIVDILNDPKVGGGVRHIAEVLVAYFMSEHRDEDTLLDYIDSFGNRTIYKRLGYLLETLDIHAMQTLEVCRKKLSAGLSYLDPSVGALGTITKRWNLRINVSIHPSKEDS